MLAIIEIIFFFSECRDMRFKAEVGTDEAHFLQHRDQVVRYINVPHWSPVIDDIGLKPST